MKDSMNVPCNDTIAVHGVARNLWLVFYVDGDRLISNANLLFRFICKSGAMCVIAIDIGPVVIFPFVEID